MFTSLASRRALVTGSGHGIGAAIALDLARAGADVVVHDRHSAEPAERTRQRIANLASAVTWLCSEGAAFITGSTIDVDGRAWFR